MSAEEAPQNPNPTAEEEKKLSKKEVAKLERLRKRQEAASAAISAVKIEADDPMAATYGEIPLNELQSKEISGKVWTKVENLDKKLTEQAVLVRGRAQAIRAVGKKMAFLVVRERGFTVQCVLTVANDLVSPQMVKFANGLSRESIVDVQGIVSLPEKEITGASHQVEIQVRNLYCVNKAIPELPINIEDAARIEVEIENDMQAGEQ
ncbi:OB-fold nucleic acid binding domain-containing protein, partial [Acinetobacter baumannii]